jgi:hypothetical protein
MKNLNTITTSRTVSQISSEISISSGISFDKLCVSNNASPQKVWDWDLEEITNQMAIERPDLIEELETIESQYRHFIYLGLVTLEELKAPDLVDEYWHIHILNTPDYVSFCHEIAGQYIHHQRKISLNLEECNQGIYQKLANLSIQHFGYQVFDFKPIANKSKTDSWIKSGINSCIKNKITSAGRFHSK